MRFLNRFCIVATVVLLGGFFVLMALTGFTQHRASRECRALGYIGATAFGTSAWCVVERRYDSTVTVEYARRHASEGER